MRLHAPTLVKCNDSIVVYQNYVLFCFYWFAIVRSILFYCLFTGFNFQFYLCRLVSFSNQPLLRRRLRRPLQEFLENILRYLRNVILIPIPRKRIIPVNAPNTEHRASCRGLIIHHVAPHQLRRASQRPNHWEDQLLVKQHKLIVMTLAAGQQHRVARRPKAEIHAIQLVATGAARKAIHAKQGFRAVRDVLPQPRKRSVFDDFLVRHKRHSGTVARGGAADAEEVVGCAAERAPKAAELAVQAVVALAGGQLVRARSDVCAANFHSVRFVCISHRSPLGLMLAILKPRLSSMGPT